MPRQYKKRMPAKKRPVKRRNAYKKRPVRNIKKIALSQQLSLKPTKKHTFQGQTDMYPFGIPAGGGSSTKRTWYIHFPLNLARLLPASINNAGSLDKTERHMREENSIYALNTRYTFDIVPDKLTIGCFTIRILMGYFKGGDNVAPNQLTISLLQALLPGAHSKMDPFTGQTNDFKVLSDRTYNYSPKQVYDSTSGDTSSESSGLSNDNRALWRPIRISRNFKFNKRFNYTGPEGDDLVGWSPFMAVQLLPCHGTPDFSTNATFTGPQGSNPCPNINLTTQTYFKDLA